MAKKTSKMTKDEPKYPKIADTRLEQLRFTLEDLKVDALVVTYLPNIRYLTNFSGSNATLFVTEDEIHFVTDDRYEEQIKDELYPLPNFYTHITREVWQHLKNKKFLKTIKSMSFEADRLSYSDAVNIRNQVRPLKFKPAPNVVEPFTMPKSPEELANIEKSTEIALKVYKKILKMIKPGVTEKEIAIEISHQGRLLGSEGDAFPVIVVSGPRCSLIHGTPSDKKIKNNEIVLLDFGCKFNGFSSDITRTLAVGKATREQKKIYKIINRAKEEAITNIRPGMNGKTVDKYARDIIEKEGYGEYFQHSLGHGIGLETHEKPIITFRMDDQIVPENCVLAIEPGIYLPNKFGIRLEDNILVTRSGGKHITKAPDEIPIV